MAQFSLNIYGKDDEIIKTFSTELVRWGVLTQAVKVQEGLNKLSPMEQFAVINEFMKKIFPDLTDDDLDNADMDDVKNTFKQLLNKVQGIGGNSKN